MEEGVEKGTSICITVNIEDDGGSCGRVCVTERVSSLTSTRKDNGRQI